MSLNPVLITLLPRTPARETEGEGGGGWDGEGAKLNFRSAGQSRETRDSEFSPARTDCRGSIQLDIENSIDFSIEFRSAVGHPVKLNGNLNKTFDIVFNIQLN